MTNVQNWSVRWAALQDAAAVAVILRDGFPDEDWAPGDVTAFATARRDGASNIVKVVTVGDLVCGAVLYTLVPDVVRLRRVAVAAGYRRRGLATAGLAAVCGPRAPLRRRLCVARVRENNSAGISFFHDRMGFGFDPTRDRERDADRNLAYYEFTLVR